MKQDKPQRRAPISSRRPSSAAAILSGKSGATKSDYSSYGWLLLLGTFLTIILISFLFTPYTHQLDEIKNVLLMLVPPVLLIAALWRMDFSEITWKRHGALILLGLYFLWMCISWLVNPYKLVGEGVIWFNLGVATFAVVFAWYMNTEDKARKTMIFFVSLGLISTVLGLFLFAGRYTQGFYTAMLQDPYWQTEARRPWMIGVYTLTSSSGDMYSFILNSDFYAAFLVMLIPVSLSMFFVEQRTGYKILALAALLLMTVCLFLTNSNDSFIAMYLVAYPVYFLLGWWFVRDWGMSRRFVFTLVGCTAALLIFVAIMMLPKLSATFDFKSAAFEGRRVLWGGGFWPWIYGDNLHGQSVDLISIIFGTGPGGYRHYFPWFRRPDFFDQQINNVTTFSHNFYLDVLLETGLVGLVLFTGFLVRVMADGVRQLRISESRTHVLYQIAILTGLVGIGVQNFSSPNNRWAVAGMIYWSMFGLSMGLASLDRAPASDNSASRQFFGIPIYRFARWASLSLAFLFALRCIAPGAQFYDYWKGATQNAEGLRDMESASSTGITAEQQITLLANSLVHFDSAIKHNPTFATSYYKLGHVYNQIGNLTDDPQYSEEAIKTYEKLNAINPNYSEVHLNLGIMYAQKAGSLPQLKVQLQKDIAELKTQMTAATGGEKARLKKEHDEKAETLKSLQETEGELRLKYMKTAYEHMKDAAHQSLKPNTQYLTGSIGRELATIYDEQGKKEKGDQVKEEAKRYFRSIITYKPRLEDLQLDQKEYYGKAQKSLLALAEETNKIEEIIAVLTQMVEDNPESKLMLNALLESYDRSKKTEEKLAYLEKAVHANPTDPALRIELAEAYKKADQPKKYVNELRRVEVLSPQDPSLLREIYQAYKTTNDGPRAKTYADKLTSLGISLGDEATTTPAAAAAGTTGPPAVTAPTASTTTSTPAPITPTPAATEPQTTQTNQTVKTTSSEAAKDPVVAVITSNSLETTATLNTTKPSTTETQPAAPIMP